MRSSLVLVAFLLSACGGKAPPPDVPEATSEAPLNPTATANPSVSGPRQLCADVDAALATARKVEVSLQVFAGEDGFGEAWVDEDNNVLKLVGSLVAESHSQEIEFHYAGGAPVCLESTMNHFNKPSYEDGGGEVESTEVRFRVFKEGALVLTEHDGNPIAISEDPDAKSEAEEAMRMAEHVRAVATGEKEQ